ncbi:hypothetical protein P7K49_014726 [Saguinus oedipus]|uniref:Uncharacterized protein n=1 Tax=Saguinus oedipus TaxID=9490 RepID=A0ABQ9V764_SAGOE|nr:hypothetical protein P7K49_014726 [Saguinus oedipus]
MAGQGFCGAILGSDIYEWVPNKGIVPAERSRGAQNNLYPNASPQVGQAQGAVGIDILTLRDLPHRGGSMPDLTAMEPAQLDFGAGERPDLQHICDQKTPKGWPETKFPNYKMNAADFTAECQDSEKPESS